MDRFDRFSDHARTALETAQHEAARLQHNYIGTEHLLLGVIGVEGGRGEAHLTDDRRPVA